MFAVAVWNQWWDEMQPQHEVIATFCSIATTTPNHSRASSNGNVGASNLNHTKEQEPGRCSLMETLAGMTGMADTSMGAHTMADERPQVPFALPKATQRNTPIYSCTQLRILLRPVAPLMRMTQPGTSSVETRLQHNEPLTG